ncbi:MAG: ferritin family protein [bacterium]
MQDSGEESKTASVEARLYRAYLAEKLAHGFYAEASTKVTLISASHAFQDMMEREEDHVQTLAEAYENTTGRPPTEQERVPREGLALPGDSVDATVAVEMAIAEEERSVRMYRSLLGKAENVEERKIYEALVKDEKEHIKLWRRVLKDMQEGKETLRRPREIFRFSSQDLHLIETALAMEKVVCNLYRDGVTQSFLVDAQHAFQAMAIDEEEHVRILEGEYRRLTGEEADVAPASAVLDWKDITKKDDCLKALEFALKEEKRSLVRYLQFEERCMNSALRRTFWQLLENEWKHIQEWRETIRNIQGHPI